MATVSTETVDIDGLVATYSAASGGGDKCAVGDNIFLHVKNADGSPTTVTLTTPGTVEGVAIADPAIVVAAGTEAFIGPITGKLFRAASDGLCAIAWSNTTSITFAVLTV